MPAVGLLHEDKDEADAGLYYEAAGQKFWLRGHIGLEDLTSLLVT